MEPWLFLGAAFVLVAFGGLMAAVDSAIGVSSRADVTDLALGSRVHATLFASPEVQTSGLEVRAEGGHIHVKGRVDHGLEDKVVKLVQNVSGVTKVTSDLYSPPPEGYLGP